MANDKLKEFLYGFMTSNKRKTPYMPIKKYEVTAVIYYDRKAYLEQGDEEMAKRVVSYVNVTITAYSEKQAKYRVTRYLKSKFALTSLDIERIKEVERK